MRGAVGGIPIRSVQIENPDRVHSGDGVFLHKIVKLIGIGHFFRSCAGLITVTVIISSSYTKSVDSTYQGRDSTGGMVRNETMSWRGSYGSPSAVSIGPKIMRISRRYDAAFNSR